LNFLYSSNWAHGGEILPFEATVLERSAVPALLSYRVNVGGVESGAETFVDSSGLDEHSDETIRPVAAFDGGSLPTGVYAAKIRTTSNFGRSRVSADSASEIAHVNERQSPFGAGWTLFGLDRLYPQEDGSLLLVEGRGNAVRFALANAQPYPELIESEGSLAYFGLTTQLTYTGDHLSSITDPASRITTFEHDTGGNLIRVVFPDGCTRSFGYDGRHLMTAETDGNLNTTRLAYDFAGKVTSATHSRRLGALRHGRGSRRPRRPRLRRGDGSEPRSGGAAERRGEHLHGRPIRRERGPDPRGAHRDHRVGRRSRARGARDQSDHLRARLMGAVVSGLVVLIPGNAVAAQLARRGGEFQINTVTEGDQLGARLAPLPDGGFVAMWKGNGNVAARRLDVDTQPLGPEFQVNTMPPNVDPDPSFAAAPDGSLFFAWCAFPHPETPPYGTGIVGRRFDPSGAPDGPEFLVALYSYRGSAVVAVGADEFVVAWTDDYDYAGRARRIGSAGLGPEFKLAPQGQQYDFAGAPATGVINRGSVIGMSLASKRRYLARSSRMEA
jgi:YD repeat-containing protein